MAGDREGGEVGRDGGAGLVVGTAEGRLTTKEDDDAEAPLAAAWGKLGLMTLNPLVGVDAPESASLTGGAGPVGDGTFCATRFTLNEGPAAPAAGGVASGLPVALPLPRVRATLNDRC